MKHARTRKARRLWQRMARIERMERGTLSRLAGRPQYNHQTWHDGRNVVRYVPVAQVAALRAAIRGYRLFRQLAEQYADEIIRRTRAAHARASSRTKRAPPKGQPRKPRP